MKLATYPEEHFYAHRLFAGGCFPPEGVWGDVLDGPVTDDEAVIEALLESFKDEIAAGDLPDSRVLRVFYSRPGCEREDCTAWAVREIDRIVYQEEFAA